MTNKLDRIAMVRKLCADGEARELRLRAGFSLREVAEPCRTGPSTVHKWETGARRPRGENALRYLSVLELIAQIDSAKAA